jgi:methionyl-tRNA formyltransferase
MRVFNVVFCGTPDFSLPTLELLHGHPNINLVSVITMPDRPAGRGQELKAPPVAEFSKTHKIPFYQVENINKEENVLKELEASKIDFIVVLAFAQFLGSRLLNIPLMGCFNIHTSILPKYRGAAPIQYALLNGDKSTGVSIQKMVKQMDAGDLVHFFEMPISADETGGQLFIRLKFQAALSMNMLIETIIKNKLTFTPQDPNGVTFAPTLKKDDGFLDFKNSTSEKIINQIKALDPWPGTYCFLNTQRLKIFSIEVVTKSLYPGITSIEYGQLFIGTLNGCLRLTSLQLEGKKICSDSELLNGLKNKGGDIIVNP